MEIRAERQIVDIPSDATGWTRLRIGLQAAGVDATGFALPSGHSPYPGLRALTEDEAALFFGRAAEILAALDELRRMAETPARRLFVILGPSGAGKSSLLRAGLWPRLARDDRNFLPLPTIRPGGAALTGAMGFWASIEGACREQRIAPHLADRVPRARGEIRAAAGADLEVCRHFMDELARAAAAAAPLEDGARPTIVIPIDQVEELSIERDGRSPNISSPCSAISWPHRAARSPPSPSAPMSIHYCRPNGGSGTDSISLSILHPCRPIGFARSSRSLRRGRKYSSSRR